HHLTAYIARAGYLLRQGHFAADVLLYSPQSTVWSQKVLFGTDRRVMPYGNVPKTLIANGYDYDPVNDDVLQNRARVENGKIKVGELAYSFVILPNITAIPVKTLEVLRKFAQGGGMVIALESLPSSSVGLADYRDNDAKVRQIVKELFGAEGKGHAYHIADYRIEEPEFNPQEKPYQPTPPLTPPQKAMLDIMRRHLAPDCALEGNRQSDGPAFIHRKIGDLDVYFVTNLQPKPSNVPVTFRISGKRPDRWDAKTGDISPVRYYRVQNGGIEIPLDLAPWESTFIVFGPGRDAAHVTKTNLAEVTGLDSTGVTGIVTANGMASVEALHAGQSRNASVTVSDLPQPLPIKGKWKLALEGVRFPRLDKEVEVLNSWTEDAQTRFFSGTGAYELDFDLPKEYLRDDLELVLDLGAVANLAEVILNGRNVGVSWMQPFRLEVTGAARQGTNNLKVLVTNNLVNHVLGLKKMPDVPAELEPHYGKTIDIYTMGVAAAKREAQTVKPQPSGLLGPVQIIARRKVKIGWNHA
ncbi:MAG: hypothetical protein M1541_03180, partial [Acidobacteria bacterium]|nr:hypothetical protein [Acidobacteriota bacterium]